MAAAELFPGTRSTDAIVKEVFVTLPPMAPDATPTEAVVSALVNIVIPMEFPAVAAPMVRPVSVTVTAVPAASALPEAVKTMEVLPGAAGTRVAPAADDFAVGVGEAAKKPDG